MTTPEFENTPNTTALFQQAYGIDRGNDDNARRVMVEAIEQDEGLMATLREHLQTEMPFEEALGLTIAAANDLGIGYIVEDAIQRQRAADDAQSEAAMEAVGLQPSQEIGHLEVADIAKFTTALQNARMPAEPEAADMLHNDLTETIGYQLFTAAIAARDLPPATLAEPLGPQQPKVAAKIAPLEEELQQLRDEFNPGSETLEAITAESGRLAQAIEDLGLPEAHSRGFRHLEIAAREGVVREWAAAHDAVLYSVMPVGEVGDMFSGRYGTEGEREQAVATIQHLQETIPGTELARETAQALLSDVQSFIDTPFDPEAGSPLSQMDVEFHDQDHGRVAETPEEDTPEQAEPTAAEAQTPTDPNDIAHLFEDFDIPVVDDGHDFDLLDWPPVPQIELATPEDSRRVKQEMYDELITDLTRMRDQVLAALPESEQRRFTQQHPTGQIDSAGNYTATNAESRTAASVGEIVAVLVTQEAALETITGYLAEAGETIINAQATIEHALRGASSDEAVATINAVAAALESLKKGRTHITDGLAHFKRFNP